MGIFKNLLVKSFTLNFCVNFFLEGERGRAIVEMPINISRQIRLTYE